MSFRTPQKILRKTIGQRTDEGYYTPSESEEIEILASVQPLNQKEYTEFEPQGGRTANLVKVYTDVELFPTKQETYSTGEIEADVLIWQNRLWRCISCDPFQSNVISHYKAIFQEVDFDERYAKEFSA